MQRVLGGFQTKEKSTMRLAFMGTPEFAVPTLDALVTAGHEVVAVYTQPPRPANRGKRLTPSAVQARAEELGLPVRTPVSLRNTEAQAEFAALDLDVAVVAAYGLILPQAILDAPNHGCLNVHGSLLPRWRGAAPVQRAILAGDTETGVCIMQMEAGLDTGPVRATGWTAISTHSIDDAGQLTRELSQLGAQLMVEVLSDLNAYPPIPQSNEGVTYAAKIEKTEAKLNFSQPSEFVERQIRAFNPVPGAFFELEGERYKILEIDDDNENADVESAPGTVLDDRMLIACGTGTIRPTLMQRAGKPAMPTADLLRGKPIPPGTILT
jgi:methionyl-tRNA formyltransferase